MSNDFLGISQKGPGGAFTRGTVGTSGQVGGGVAGVTVYTVTYTVSSTGNGNYDSGIPQLQAGCYIRDASLSQGDAPLGDGEFSLGLANSQGGVVVDDIFLDQNPGNINSITVSPFTPLVVGANTWVTVFENTAASGETFKIRLEVICP